MHIELIENIDDFSGIKEAWQTLYDGLGENISAFSSVEWYETWWRYYSSGEHLHLVAMWDDGKLVGVAPLMLRRATIHGLPAKVICFIDNNQSPHNDFIVLPSARELFLRGILRLLIERMDITPWDVVVFNKLPVTSANYDMLIGILNETGVTWRQEQVLDSRYITPNASWDEFMAGRSARTRKSLRNIQNRMHNAGEVSIRHIRTWEEFQRVREEVYYVARQSWTEEVGDSIASPANEAFFDDLARSAAAKGWLSLWALCLNGKIIAIEFHLRANGKVHAMRGHYLPEYASLSPGTYLEMQILKSAFEEPDRVRKYDLGNFYSYKRKWTTDAEPHMAVFMFNNRTYSRFLAFHETVTVPLLSRVLPQNFWNHSIFKKCGIKTDRLHIKQH